MCEMSFRLEGNVLHKCYWQDKKNYLHIHTVIKSGLHQFTTTTTIRSTDGWMLKFNKLLWWLNIWYFCSLTIAKFIRYIMCPKINCTNPLWSSFLFYVSCKEPVGLMIWLRRLENMRFIYCISIWSLWSIVPSVHRAQYTD